MHTQVSVLNHKQHAVTVTAKISTTGDVQPAACAKNAANSSNNYHEEAFSCGDFFVAMGDDDNACSSWYYNI